MSNRISSLYNEATQCDNENGKQLDVSIKPDYQDPDKDNFETLCRPEEVLLCVIFAM